MLLMRDDCPPHTRVLDVLRTLVDGPDADVPLVQHLERCWRDRLFGASYERPLLMLAALRHEALVEGARHPLFDAIGATNPNPASVTRERVLASMSPDRASFWIALTSRKVQTNEVTRSVVWRWPAWLAGCDASRRPVALVDIGASAGLNLVAERLGLKWADARGAALPVAVRIDARARIGFDASPLDVRFDDDVAWLRACIWPGDHQRLARFDDAVKAMRAAYEDPVPPEMHALQAGLVPQRLEALSRTLGDVLVLAYQTFVRGYLDPERAELYARGMNAWLGAHPGSALWVECEISDAAERDADLPAEIVAHTCVGDPSARSVRALCLARTGYHPRVVRVDEPACAELRAAIAPKRV